MMVYMNGEKNEMENEFSLNDDKEMVIKGIIETNNKPDENIDINS